MDNENKEFEERLVEKIKMENIAPKARWRFLLKNYVIWAAGLVSLLIGAAAVSVMIYLFLDNGWELTARINRSWLDFFLLTLPYFWIIFLGLFILLLFYNLKHTKKGYRYPVSAIIASSVLSSVFLGGIFFLTGLGGKIDEVLGERAPFYTTVINRHISFWFNPSEGRLTGVVISKIDDQDFSIVDPRGADWIVVSPDDLPAQLIMVNQPVDLIGRVVDKNRFEAEIIRPVVSGRGFLMRPRLRVNEAIPCQADQCPILVPQP